ncbi:MAG: PIN domain-containing protein [Endomicrobium sp.]|jgi:predicted nucleic acid-binding protein|uniref:PIN domain-containing protein n=1 Tax=Candidatus Endomicrobiellum cubanum TaxID=3242325 RepID=UPI002833D849|nr:PIN domain-containing protein [Endomicrobium sp.]
MNNILIDSSVWIEYFRGNKNFLFVNDLIVTNVLCTNELILTELLPFILYKKEFDLSDLLCSIRKLKMTINWEELCSFQLINIKNGNNTVGIPDLMIAQNCRQNKCKLLSCDKHFRVIAKFLPLEVYNYPI